MHELFFTHHRQNQGDVDADDLARLREFKRFIRPFVKTGVRIKGDALAEWHDELEIVSDYRFLRHVGWTFSQLAAEREAHPYEVLLSQVYQSVVDDVESTNAKAMKAKSNRKAKKRG